MLLSSYKRFAEKTELFTAKEEAQAQNSLLKTILNELDNGILIAHKLLNSTFKTKYINKVIT